MRSGSWPVSRGVTTASVSVALLPDEPAPLPSPWQREGRLHRWTACSGRVPSSGVGAVGKCPCRAAALAVAPHEDIISDFQQARHQVPIIGCRRKVCGLPSLFEQLLQHTYGGMFVHRRVSVVRRGIAGLGGGVKGVPDRPQPGPIRFTGCFGVARDWQNRADFLCSTVDVLS